MQSLIFEKEYDYTNTIHLAVLKTKKCIKLKVFGSSKNVTRKQRYAFGFTW